MGLIYVLEDPRFDDPIRRDRYVGKTAVGTAESRLVAHICEARTSKKKIHRLNWLRLLLSKGLKPSIRVVEICDDDLLDTREIFWIKEFRKLGHKLVNSTAGGDGIRGWHHSVETRKKISEKAKNRVVSQETRDKKRRSMLGKKHSAASRQRRSEMTRGRNNPMFGKSGELNPMYGRKHTEETKQKDGDAHRKITDNEIIEHLMLGFSCADIAALFGMSRKRLHFRCSCIGMDIGVQERRLWAISNAETVRRNKRIEKSNYFANDPRATETRRRMSEARKAWWAGKMLDKPIYFG